MATSVVVATYFAITDTTPSWVAAGVACFIAGNLARPLIEKNEAARVLFLDLPLVITGSLIILFSGVVAAVYPEFTGPFSFAFFGAGILTGYMLVNQEQS